MKVLFVSNHEVTLYYFRTELIEKLTESGNEVYISQPFGKLKDYFESLGCVCLDSSVTQYGMNPLKEYRLIGEYKKQMKSISPDIVVTYTIKPNLYAAIAAASLGIPYISTVTGLGGAFRKEGLLKKISLLFYRYSQRKTSALFFQNQSNSDLFTENKIALNRHIIVNGSGVNLKKHPFFDYPEWSGELNLLYIGRVMNDKGIRELFGAVSQLNSKGIHVVLNIVGWCEDECKNLLEDAVKNDYIIYHGWQENVNPFIEKCHALILPSYHEGMANVLLEAEACGRPVLASDIHGCIETFIDGKSGFSFESESTSACSSAIERFFSLPYEKKCEMGKTAREFVESNFDREQIAQFYFDKIYEYGDNKL